MKPLLDMQVFYWTAIVILFFGTLNVLRRPAGKTKETLVWLMQDLFLLAVAVAFWPPRSQTAAPAVFALGIVGLVLRVVIRVRLHEEATSGVSVPQSNIPVLQPQKKPKLSARKKRHHAK